MRSIHKINYIPLYTSPLTSIFFITQIFPSWVNIILNFHFLILRSHEVHCKGDISYPDTRSAIISWTICSNITLIFAGIASIFFCRALVIVLKYVLNILRNLSGRCVPYQNQRAYSIFRIAKYLQARQQVYYLWIRIFHGVIILQDILWFWILSQWWIHIVLLALRFS